MTLLPVWGQQLINWFWLTCSFLQWNVDEVKKWFWPTWPSPTVAIFHPCSRQILAAEDTVIIIFVIIIFVISIIAIIIFVIIIIIFVIIILFIIIIFVRLVAWAKLISRRKYAFPLSQWSFAKLVFESLVGSLPCHLSPGLTNCALAGGGDQNSELFCAISPCHYSTRQSDCPQ